MISDILAAGVVSASFALGSVLYYWAAEEVDAVKQKFRSKILSQLKQTSLAPIGVFGVVQAAATKTPHLEIISLIFLMAAIAFGSLVVAEKDKKLTVKYTIETIGTFLMFFFTVYVFLNLESLF